MRIEALDASSLSEDTAASLVHLVNTVAQVDAPHVSPVSARHLQLRLKHGWDAHPTAHLFAAMSPDDQIVAYAEVNVEVWDNLHVASPTVEAYPAERSTDIEDRLLEVAHAAALEAGRTLMIGGAWAGTHGEKFWQRHGYSVASRAAQRRLVVADLDLPELDRLHATAVAASRGYDIVALPHPSPQDIVPELLDLHHAMNDSPTDDLDVEDEVWTGERLRAHERAMTCRGMLLYRLVARRRADGVLGGHTVVAIEDERPHLAWQEDTAVVRGHRGHRLGLRLKTEMLRLLRDVAPAVVQIDTWNAESNDHMIAVNDALGCVVVGRGLEMQTSLA